MERCEKVKKIKIIRRAIRKIGVYREERVQEGPR
jgi:hypothetical protein